MPTTVTKPKRPEKPSRLDLLVLEQMEEIEQHRGRRPELVEKTVARLKAANSASSKRLALEKGRGALDFLRKEVRSLEKIEEQNAKAEAKAHRDELIAEAKSLQSEAYARGDKAEVEGLKRFVTALNVGKTEAEAREIGWPTARGLASTDEGRALVSGEGDGGGDAS